VTIIYLAIAYPMTGQPMEFYRVLLMTVLGIQLCMVAQAIGLFAGSIFDIQVNLLTNGSFYCSIIFILFLFSEHIHVRCFVDDHSHCFEWSFSA
jgi:hypothetical protein